MFESSTKILQHIAKNHKVDFSLSSHEWRLFYNENSVVGETEDQLLYCLMGIFLIVHRNETNND